MAGIAETWAKIAGIGGISLFVLLVIFRDVIRKNIFPQLNAAQAYRVIRLVIICTFVVAISGLGAWVLISVYPAVRFSEKDYDFMIAAAAAAELSRRPGDSASSDERLAKLQYMEQLRDSPEAYSRFVEAIRRAREILEREKSVLPGENVERAKQRLRTGDINSAVVMLQTVAARNTEEAAEARFTAGNLLASKADVDAALQEYIAASQAMPSEEKYFISAVELALNTGKIPVAESLLASRFALISGGLMVGAESEGLYLGLSGLAKWYGGRLVEAEADFDKALEKLTGRKSLTLAAVLEDSGPIYKSRGLYSVAEERLTNSAAIFRCLLSDKDTRYLNSMLNLSAIYILEGDFDAAQATVGKVVSTLEATGLKQPYERYLAAQSYAVRGNLSRAKGSLPDAEKNLLEAFRLLDELHATQTHSYARAQIALGDTYLQEGRLELAAKLLAESLSLNIHIFGDDHFETGVSYLLLAATWAKRGEIVRSRGYLESAKHALGERMKSSPQFARVHEVEGDIEFREGRYPEAERSIRKACDIYAALPVIDVAKQTSCYASLSEVLRKAGRAADASKIEVLRTKLIAQGRRNARTARQSEAGC